MKLNFLLKVLDAVADSLSDELRRPPWRGHKNPLAGHCYVASEATFHLLGGRESPWFPMFVRHEGQPHWYLSCGLVNLDLTARQFRSPIPRDRATRKGFLTKEPSKRARIVMERVLKRFPARDRRKLVTP